MYRANNVTLQRIVALKTLAPGFAADQDFVHRFLKEARVAARLNHPNIVQIYDFGNVDGIHYLAMEYVDGQSLRTHMKGGRFSERDAITVIRQAVRALSVAHAAGIVHRDIKPDNIMFTSKGELKLVDLGIAKRLDEDQSLTLTGEAVGTPQYISPEQIRGAKDIDARADIYSLGATFYHLVTGHAPYKGTSGALVMSMHLTHPLPDPRIYEPILSDGVCRVLRKMMAKERDERYPSMDALDRDLYQLQIGETPDVDEPGITGIATMADTDRVGSPRTARPAGGPGQNSTPQPAGSRVRSATSHQEGRGGTFGTPFPEPTPAPVFREEDLHFVAVELARHIGPLARMLVKKAAKTAPNLVALAAAVAENIPDEKGRVAFRAAVRARAK